MENTFCPWYIQLISWDLKNVTYLEGKQCIHIWKWTPFRAGSWDPNSWPAQQAICAIAGGIQRSSPGTEQLSKPRHTEAALLAFRALCLLSGCCSEKMQVSCSFLLSVPDPNICLADLPVSKLVLSSYFSSTLSLHAQPQVKS